MVSSLWLSSAWSNVGSSHISNMVLYQLSGWQDGRTRETEMGHHAEYQANTKGNRKEFITWIPKYTFPYFPTYKALPRNLTATVQALLRWEPGANYFWAFCMTGAVTASKTGCYLAVTRQWLSIVCCVGPVSCFACAVKYFPTINWIVRGENTAGGSQYNSFPIA